jgi:hypothetical protein
VWSIERRSGADDDTPWRVTGRSSSDSMIPVITGSMETALLNVEYDALSFLLRTATHAIAVHAALLSKDGQGVLVVGPSLAGKSTLATALWQAGWSLLSDDLVFIDPDGRTARPAPRRVSLRFESRELIGEKVWSAIEATPSCAHTRKGLFFHPHELTGEQRQKETPIAGIFFLARMDAQMSGPETRVINPARGALALVPYSFNVRTLPFAQALARMAPVAASTPMFDLGRGNLPAMIAAVEARLG